jgi:murein DD-endopeptidase MepM/ murein hydrolase activator NlpD
METFFLDILPGFKNEQAALLDLNEISLQSKKQPAISRFLDAHLVNRFLRFKHSSLNVAYSFGGYLENRKDLWRGSYLGHDNAVHLGIDVNVPQGTSISVKYPCHVSSIVHDNDQKGGWGGTILFKLEKPIGSISHFLYAHLSHKEMRVSEKQRLTAGEIVGKLGTPEENGGWYEHLHVQAITQEAWDKFQGNLYAFDGYGQLHKDEKEHSFFPNPMPLITG